MSFNWDDDTAMDSFISPFITIVINPFLCLQYTKTYNVDGVKTKKLNQTNEFNSNDANEKWNFT